jgi:hypothetical protein
MLSSTMMRAPVRLMAMILAAQMSLSRADGASEPDQGRADAKPPKSGCAARRATSNASTIARYRPLCAVRSLGRTNAPTGQARGATNEHGTRARALGPSGPTMIIPSYVVTLWALLFVSCGPTAAQSVAVFVANCENPIADARGLVRKASSISSISLEPVFTSSISSIFHCGPAAHS